MRIFMKYRGVENIDTWTVVIKKTIRDEQESEKKANKQ